MVTVMQVAPVWAALFYVVRPDFANGKRGNFGGFCFGEGDSLFFNSGGLSFAFNLPWSCL
jgi:hypothetical protein